MVGLIDPPGSAWWNPGPSVVELRSVSADAETAPTFDADLFRRVMGRFATGVAVVSYLRDGEPAGMTVNTFLSVSLEPPLVLVSVRRTSGFTRYVVAGSRFGINVLAERQACLAPHFASRPEQEVRVRFGDHAGVPLLEESLAHIVARVVDIHPAGDHLLYIAAVEHLVQGAEATPLIFFRGRYWWVMD